MKKLLVIGVYALLIALTSCKKDLVSQLEPDKVEPTTTQNGKVEKMDDLKVDAKFDWKTTQDITLKLTGYANSMLEVTTLSGKPVEKFMVKTNEVYTTNITLPTSEKVVTLHYMGQEINIDLNKPVIEYVFN